MVEKGSDAREFRCFQMVDAMLKHDLRCREQPDQVLICGGCANIPGVADVIGSRVGIATQIGDPLGQMKISGRAKSQGVDRDATALLTACGLALRSFD